MGFKASFLAGILAFWGQGAMGDPSFWAHEFPKTDFSRTSVESWGEILSGGPARDGIPALFDPKMITAAQADLPARAPVITVELEGQIPRAYPLRYLMWHEIANDVIGDVPVAVTFCPLCNSALTFDRRVGGAVLSFGVSGKLRASDMIMYDRETESWWQQASGTGIVGVHTGARLTLLPTWMESFAAFAARNPEGMVMAPPSHRRPYGQNPYEGYDSRERPYPFFTGEAPPHGIPALARVVRVGNRAWPMTRIAPGQDLSEAGFVIQNTGDLASALDAAQITNGRSVAMIRVKDTNGRDVAHDVMFAFAFHALFPQGTWMLGQ